MNESEARRAALTAAIAWCSNPGTGWGTDDVLAHAERFEEWLTRPGLPGVAITDVPVIQLPGAWRAPKRVRPNPYCTACEHAPHGAGACSEACSCTSTYTGVVPQQRVPHDPYMDGPEPDVPQRVWTCAMCDHERHPGAYCSQCPCAHGRRPR